MSNLSEKKYQELDLSKLDGLQVFSDSVEDSFSEGMRCIAVAVADNYERLSAHDVSGKEVFQTFEGKHKILSDTIKKCKTILDTEKKDIPDRLIDDLQNAYNDLILLRDYIVGVYNTSESEVPSDVRASNISLGDDNLPPESEVALLIKKVTENLFLVESEREQVLFRFEKYNRSVAEGNSNAESLKLYSELRMFINNLEINPNPKAIVERANRILEHVSASHEIPSQVLEKAMDLFEEVKDAEVNFSHDKNILLKAYMELEQYARERESDWLSICGVRIPAEGSAGIKQAKRLRSILLIEKNNHPDLKDKPEKKILVENLIKILIGVSEGGLSSKELSEIVKLAHKIDVPNGHSEVFLLDDGSDEYTATRPRRKTMRVVQDDTEQNIKITVANQVEDSIKANESRQSINHVLATADMNRDELLALARDEANDPINDSVAVRSTAQPQNSLTLNYLNNARYLTFIKKNYISSKAFDKFLETTITQIESKTLDTFEKWLGERFESPFMYLKDMTVWQIKEFISMPDMRKIIADENIKYETFLTWIDLIPQMQAVVNFDQNLKFAELFSRWVIENQMSV